MSRTERGAAERQTVLAMGAGRRMATAAALIGALWLAVGWALDWWL
jgi:hypothetical protein